MFQLFHCTHMALIHSKCIQSVVASKVATKSLADKSKAYSEDNNQH